jgi:TetR/AcrR family fatty acid metabolism transcriptional regulator
MKNNDFTERQIEIMEAATLRIDKFGIQELTIKNLASDLSLSEAALYRHFKSKNENIARTIDLFYFRNERATCFNNRR